MKSNTNKKIRSLKSYQAEKLLSYSSGFTIIETLVALAIFTFSIVGLIVITSQGIADTNFAKNKFVASYLAQEGIEMVRNVRDSGALTGAAWEDTFQQNALAGLGTCFASAQSTGCDIDADTFAIDSCSAASRNGCGPLRYDISTGAYILNSRNAAVPESPFSRVIALRTVSANEVEITSTVAWSQGTTSRSVTVVETLADWITITPTAL